MTAARLASRRAMAAVRFGTAGIRVDQPNRVSQAGRRRAEAVPPGQLLARSRGTRRSPRSLRGQRRRGRPRSKASCARRAETRRGHDGQGIVGSTAQASVRLRGQASCRPLFVGPSVAEPGPALWRLRGVARRRADRGEGTRSAVRRFGMPLPSASAVAVRPLQSGSRNPTLADSVMMCSTHQTGAAFMSVLRSQ
jgi:hypothetical protein